MENDRFLKAQTAENQKEKMIKKNDIRKKKSCQKCICDMIFFSDITKISQKMIKKNDIET